MKVLFLCDDNCVLEKMVECVPHSDDVVVIRGESYVVLEVIHDMDDESIEIHMMLMSDLPMVKEDEEEEDDPYDLKLHEEEE